MWKLSVSFLRLESASGGCCWQLVWKNPNPKLLTARFISQKFSGEHAAVYWYPRSTGTLKIGVSKSTLESARKCPECLVQVLVCFQVFFENTISRTESIVTISDNVAESIFSTYSGKSHSRVLSIAHSCTFPPYGMLSGTRYLILLLECV